MHRPLHPVLPLLAAAAALAIWAAPAGAQLATKGEYRCSTGIAKAQSYLLAAKAKCVRSCLAARRKTSGPYADCLPPFGGATATCVSGPKGAEAKASKAIVKSCAADCPECYQPGVCTDPAPIVAAGTSVVAAHLAAVYCVEGAGGTPSKKEAKCEKAVSGALARLARAETSCFNKCNAGIRAGRLFEDRCYPWGPRDPKTLACLERAKAAAVKAIDRACAPAGASPACHAGATGATWAATIDPLVHVRVPAKPDGTSCDDGVACTSGDFCDKGRCVLGHDSCFPSDLCLNSVCDRKKNRCTPVTPTTCPQFSDPCWISECAASNGVCITRCNNPNGCGDGIGICGSSINCTSNADCDDGNVCTADICDTSGVCRNPWVSCDDGDRCSQDFCLPAGGGCVSHRREPSFCDDSNPTTVDVCEPFIGCLNTPD